MTDSSPLFDPVRGVAEAMLRQYQSSHEQLTHRWETPGELAKELDHRTKQTPALSLIDEELVRLVNTQDGRLLISMPPQEGKSQRASRRFPAWVLSRNPDTRLAVISYELGMARRWGRVIRDDINQHRREFGISVREDLAAQQEWQLNGFDGGVYSAGIGGALTGRAVDGLIIDDPIKDREQADSATYRERTWDWWREVGATRLSPGAWVVVIATRWHEDDLIGRLLAAEDGDIWRVINIPAQADHDESKNEVDPLDRDPGEFLVSARGRTPQQWENIKVRSGGRAWNALYQGHPAPLEGGLFKRSWWREYTSTRWVVSDDGSHWAISPDEVVQSWDMAFKNLDASDYVVGQVWGRWGLQVYLLDQICEHLSFVETRAAVRQLSAKWPQTTAKYIEDKANGPAVINSLSHIVSGMIPVEPDGTKESRAAAITPFVEAGSVHLPAPEFAPWVSAYVDEHASFPNGSHDDQVDATSQALNRLLLNPITTQNILVDAQDLDEELAAYNISPY